MRVVTVVRPFSLIPDRKRNESPVARSLACMHATYLYLVRPLLLLSFAVSCERRLLRKKKAREGERDTLSRLSRDLPVSSMAAPVPRGQRMTARILQRALERRDKRVGKENDVEAAENYLTP